MNLYNLSFWMVFFFLILRYIKKMATDGGGGVVDDRARRFQARIYWSRVEIPTRMQIFFSLIFVYKLYSTNSYNYTNFIVQIHTIIQIIVQIHTIRTFFLQIVYYEFIQQRERAA